MSRPRKPPPAIPPIEEGKRGPQGHLGYLVRQANVAVRAALERALADTGATTPQFAVLTMIVAYPGISGADLARLTFLTPQTINVIVRNLFEGFSDGIQVNGGNRNYIGSNTFTDNALALSMTGEHNVIDGKPCY